MYAMDSHQATVLSRSWNFTAETADAHTLEPACPACPSRMLDGVERAEAVHLGSRVLVRSEAGTAV